MIFKLYEQASLHQTKHYHSPSIFSFRITCTFSGAPFSRRACILWLVSFCAFFSMKSCLRSWPVLPLHLSREVLRVNRNLALPSSRKKARLDQRHHARQCKSCVRTRCLIFRLEKLTRKRSGVVTPCVCVAHVYQCLSYTRR